LGVWFGFEESGRTTETGKVVYLEVCAGDFRGRKAPGIVGKGGRNQSTPRMQSPSGKMTQIEKIPEK